MVKLKQGRMDLALLSAQGRAGFDRLWPKEKTGSLPYPGPGTKGPAQLKLRLAFLPEGRDAFSRVRGGGEVLGEGQALKSDSVPQG